jgi:hypothetical protein
LGETVPEFLSGRGILGCGDHQSCFQIDEEYAPCKENKEGGEREMESC